MEESRQQTALIEDRRRITVTGVESVGAFSAQQIVLTLTDGRAVVSGSDLKISNFSKASHSFTADGNVSGIRFQGKREKIAKRLFG